MSIRVRNWVDFWNAENNCIYVSARHRDVHYRLIADHVTAFVPGPDCVVLDFGCGHALQADRIAAAVGRLVLSDAAPGIRDALAARYAGHQKIEVRPPDELMGWPDATFDLIVLVSVTQYLSAAELDRLLALFHRLLKPSGELVLGDVVPPSVSPIGDALALLRLAAPNGFLGAAVWGLIRTVFSDYRKLRTALGLTFYREPAMLAKLAAAGFQARRAPENIGYNQARMTFRARPKPA
jgi:SAM-dependent methyltransferase